MARCRSESFFYGKQNGELSRIEIVQGLNRKRRNTEAMEDLEDHHRLKYKEADEETKLLH